MRRARPRTKLVQIGAEDGRLIEPSAFDVAHQRQLRGGRCAEWPRARPDLRCGRRCAPADSSCRAAARRASCSDRCRSTASARSSFNGRTLLMSHPETGWLMTEYGLGGTPLRSIGQLRKTGHESDRDLHLALEFGDPDRRSGRRIFFRLHGRRAGVPQVRRQGRADLRADRPGPRDRSAGRRRFPIAGRGATPASCRWWRRSFEPRP